jgi:hypothetical protein
MSQVAPEIFLPDVEGLYLGWPALWLVGVSVEKTQLGIR